MLRNLYLIFIMKKWYGFSIGRLSVKVWKGCKRLAGEETAAYYSLTCRMESRAR